MRHLMQGRLFVGDQPFIQATSKSDSVQVSLKVGTSRGAARRCGVVAVPD